MVCLSDSGLGLERRGNELLSYDKFETGLLFLLLDPLWEVVLVRNHWFTDFSLIVLKKLNKPQCINKKSWYKNRKTTTCKKLQTTEKSTKSGTKSKTNVHPTYVFFFNLALHQSKPETNNNF